MSGQTFSNMVYCSQIKNKRGHERKMKMIKKITRTDITNDTQLERELIKVSKDNPKKYITFFVTFGKTRIFIHDRKPQSPNTGGSDETFRTFGGFFRNGEIVKPSETFIKKFSFCPVLG
jgi:hypothetical protein